MLTGEERMTFVANFNINFLQGGTGGELVTAGTGNLTIFEIFRMNSSFHRGYFNINLVISP